MNARRFAVIDPTNKKKFLDKYRFPKEWEAWEMLPEPMLEELYTLSTEEDDEEGGYRNFRLDAFFYWLKQELTEVQIKKLFQLSLFEKSGKYMRSSIHRHKNCSESLRMELFGYTKLDIPKFTKIRLAELLEFPQEWLTWEMYPEELFVAHRKAFQPGNESDSENERNEAFHYWLSKELSENQLIQLAKLSLLDPDPIMAKNIQDHIQNHKNCTPNVKQLLQ